MLYATGPADARLIDFEFAGYIHALTDAVCLYVPGPAWLTVGNPTTTGLADQYRHALARRPGGRGRPAVRRRPRRCLRVLGTSPSAAVRSARHPLTK
jgi:hypothetical protein